MAAKRCPRCKLVNPGSAVRCDCGFSFVDESIGPALDLPAPEAQRRDRERSRLVGPSIISVGIAVIALVVRSIARDGYSRSDRPVIIGTIVLGALVTAAGVALTFTKRR